MDRTYEDVRLMTEQEMFKKLLDLRVERYLADPVMAREFIREVLEKDQSWDRHELIDGLYDEGYWA